MVSAELFLKKVTKFSWGIKTFSNYEGSHCGRGARNPARPAEKSSQTPQGARDFNMRPAYVTSAKSLKESQSALERLLDRFAPFLQATEKAAIAPASFLLLQGSRARWKHKIAEFQTPSPTQRQLCHIVFC